MREPGEAAIRAAVRRIAVIDHERASLHQRVRDKTPIPTVEGVVAIISQDKIIPLWDDQRSPVVSRWMISRRFGASDYVVTLPAEILRRRIHVRFRMFDISLLHQQAVSDQ